MKQLILDIETTPNLAHVWGLWGQNVEPFQQLRQHGSVIGVGAKWVGKPRVDFFSDHHHGHDEMVQKTWALLDEADAVVTYNGKRFDLPWLKTEFIKAGMTPPSPWRDVDLLEVAKRQLRLASNKLGYVTTYLGLSGKLTHTGHKMWVDIMEGTPEQQEKAWNLIRRYCKQDVRTTEELYHRLLPWIPNLPNRNLYDGTTHNCPACGSPDLQRRGTAVTLLTTFQRFQCQACGKWSRTGKADHRSELREAK